MYVSENKKKYIADFVGQIKLVLKSRKILQNKEIKKIN